LISRILPAVEKPASCWSLTLFKRSCLAEKPNSVDTTTAGESTRRRETSTLVICTPAFFVCFSHHLVKGLYMLVKSL